MTRLAAALLVATSAGVTGHGATSVLVTREVYLMGTRAQLATYAPTRQRGLTTLASAVSVLEGTEAELSTWRDSSDLSRLNRQPIGSPWHVPASLCGTFVQVWRWHEETGGSFDPGIGKLLDAWDIHGEGSIPSPEIRRRAAEASGLAHLSFDRARCTVTRRADVAIDPGAFGKGDALDRVARALHDTAWMIDLGGQVSAGGPAPLQGWEVAIAHPVHRDQAYLKLRLRDGSLSTSGGSERDLTVNGVRIPHIFDPRTGAPASFTGSVTVWHRSGLAADALSTALYVMGPAEGGRWAESRGIAALYLIPGPGGIRRQATSAFSALE